jgi:DNA primase
MTLTTSDIERARQVPITNLLGSPPLTRKRMIRCPFHADRTASLCLYPNNGFHCFGCGAHGHNAIDFCIKLGYNFKDAVIEVNRHI